MNLWLRRFFKKNCLSSSVFRSLFILKIAIFCLRKSEEKKFWSTNLSKMLKFSPFHSILTRMSPCPSGNCVFFGLVLPFRWYFRTFFTSWSFVRVFPCALMMRNFPSTLKHESALNNNNIDKRKRACIILMVVPKFISWIICCNYQLKKWYCHSFCINICPLTLISIDMVSAKYNYSV